MKGFCPFRLFLTFESGLAAGPQDRPETGQVAQAADWTLPCGSLTIGIPDQRERYKALASHEPSSGGAAASNLVVLKCQRRFAVRNEQSLISVATDGNVNCGVPSDR